MDAPAIAWHDGCGPPGPPPARGSREPWDTSDPPAPDEFAAFLLELVRAYGALQLCGRASHAPVACCQVRGDPLIGIILLEAYEGPAGGRWMFPQIIDAVRTLQTEGVTVVVDEVFTAPWRHALPIAETKTGKQCERPKAWAER